MQPCTSASRTSMMMHAFWYASSVVKYGTTGIAFPAEKRSATKPNISASWNSTRSQRPSMKSVKLTKEREVSSACMEMMQRTKNPASRRTCRLTETVALALRAAASCSSVMPALLGITSFLYHASLTHLAQTLDVAAIYWGLTVMGSANLSKFFILIPNVTCRWWCNMMMLVLSACVGSPLLFEYKKKMNSTEMLVILVLTNVGLMTLHWLLFRAKVAVSWKWMGLSAVSLALAAYFRQGEVDKWGMPCDPESFFQGHSMWHFLTATSFFQAYMFMRSERHKVEDGGGVRPENVGVFGWMRGCCCCGGGGGGGGNGSSQAGAGGGASGAAVASSKGYPVRCGDVEMAETKESSKEGEDESKVAAQVV